MSLVVYKVILGSIQIHIFIHKAMLLFSSFCEFFIFKKGLSLVIIGIRVQWIL